MSVSITLSNLTWSLSAYPTWQRFKKHAKDPESAQQKILDKIVTANRETDFGKAHGFENIKNYADFKALVPLQNYEEFKTDILRIARGEEFVLTTEPVKLLEPSGGSSGGIKYIPYTEALSQEFKRGIQVWIFDLFSSIPTLINGQAYWSISPANESPQIEGLQVPIGFNDDSEYLSNFGRRLMNRVLAVPGIVSQIRDMNAFRYVTLLFLLRVRNLRLISVWNPTFLSLLMDELPRQWEPLLRDIRTGEINNSLDIPEAIRTQLDTSLRADQRRARELQEIGSGDLSMIWPKLRLISCWRDGPADHYAQRLQRNYFPTVEFQGKGLLATEAFVSFPLHDGEDPVLAIDSHFYEFLPLDSFGAPLTEDPHRAHELEQGKRYAVAVSTSGGLYRYQMHDIIEVTAYYQKVPRFRFIGKTEGYSDLFGEKLTESFVLECLNEVFSELALEPAFMLISPEESADTPHYCLYLEFEPPVKAEKLELAKKVDQRLRQNYHYDYCRNLGQLGPLVVNQISSGSAGKYLQIRHRRGQKLGDIKPSILDRNSGWGDIFEVAN